jgi:hypothetical protein
MQIRGSSYVKTAEISPQEVLEDLILAVIVSMRQLNTRTKSKRKAIFGPSVNGIMSVHASFSKSFLLETWPLLLASNDPWECYHPMIFSSFGQHRDQQQLPTTCTLLGIDDNTVLLTSPLHIL